MITQGKEPPPEYYTKPELDPALVYLLDAFYDLTTERQIGMAVGPIPRSKIKEYGRDDLGLEGEALHRFISTIYRIDGEYMKFSSARADDPLRAAEPKKPKLMKPKMRPPLTRKERR